MGLEPAFIGDASTAGGGLTCYAMAPAPLVYLKKKLQEKILNVFTTKRTDVSGDSHIYLL